MTKRELYEFIEARRLAVLATVSPSNAPEAALAGVAVTPNLELIFDTVKNTRKYQNLRSNPRIAFVIGLEGEVTVQYEGVAEELGGEALARCKSIYFANWPDGREREKWPGIVYFIVRPTWVRLADYSTMPERIAEMTF
jgi:uncharacterized protein YhbP (UPF0306 family)